MTTFRSTRPAPCPAILRTFLQTRCGDFEHLKHLIHLVPWSVFIDTNDINESTENFNDLFDAAIRDSIPKVSKRKSRHTPWITPELNKLINEKHKLFNLARKSGRPLDWTNYKTARNVVKKNYP